MIVRWTVPVADCVSILISFAARQRGEVGLRRTSHPNLSRSRARGRGRGIGCGPVCVRRVWRSRERRLGRARYPRRRARALRPEGGADRRRRPERLRRPEGLAVRPGRGATSCRWSTRRRDSRPTPAPSSSTRRTGIPSPPPLREGRRHLAGPLRRRDVGRGVPPDLDVVGPSVRKGTNGEDGYSGFTMKDPTTGETIADRARGAAPGARHRAGRRRRARDRLLRQRDRARRRQARLRDRGPPGRDRGGRPAARATASAAIEPRCSPRAACWGTASARCP